MAALSVALLASVVLPLMFTILLGPLYGIIFFFIAVAVLGGLATIVANKLDKL
jgi:hypothetical protein